MLTLSMLRRLLVALTAFGLVAMLRGKARPLRPPFQSTAFRSRATSERGRRCGALIKEAQGARQQVQRRES